MNPLSLDPFWDRLSWDIRDDLSAAQRPEDTLWQGQVLWEPRLFFVMHEIFGPAWMRARALVAGLILFSDSNSRAGLTPTRISG